MPDETTDEGDRRPEIAEPVSSEREFSGETGPEMDRLPPPAFPPGSADSRHRRVPRAGASVPPDPGEGEDESVPFDGFIAPDDPVRKEARGIPDDAFIAPDDPLVPADRNASGKVPRPPQDEDDAPATRRAQRSGDRERPTIHELPYLLNQLAERLRESGERALNVDPETGHFQAALRSFLRGYLQGSWPGSGD